MLCGLLLQEKRVNNFWDILTFICVVVRSDFLWNLAFMIPLLRLFCFARFMALQFALLISRND